MENVWERFNDIADISNVLEAKSQFKKVEPGNYDMVLEELSPAENRHGRPMLKGKFRLVESNQLLFYNHNLEVLGYQELTDQNIAEAILLVEGLVGGDVEISNLGELATFIEKIPTGKTYRIEVSYGKKDQVEMNFPKLKIIPEIDTSELAGFNEIGDEDIPF